MVKQHTDKHLINLGHNNPPEDIKNIEFTKTAIEKLKVDDLDFGKKVVGGFFALTSTFSQL